MDPTEQVPDWFDFAEIYDHMVARAQDGAVFVEVGAYLGRSSLYLASRIQRSSKQIRLYVVDRWDDGAAPERRRGLPLQAQTVFGQFIRNIRHAGVEDVIYPLRLPSEQAASLFEDGTLDFVFVDSAPGYEAVRSDLEAWFPKVKRRGVLGGHPYLHSDFPGVRTAADAFFMEQELPIQIHGSSFLVIKPSPRWLKAAQRTYRRLAPETRTKGRCGG